MVLFYRPGFDRGVARDQIFVKVEVLEGDFQRLSAVGVLLAIEATGRYDQFGLKPFCSEAIERVGADENVVVYISVEVIEPFSPYNSFELAPKRHPDVKTKFAVYPPQNGRALCFI